MRRRSAAVLGLMVTCFACVRHLPGQDPSPQAWFYYPSRLALSADGAAVFVVNTNFDLRYNVGWISQVNLRALLPILAAAGMSHTLVTESDAAAAVRQSIRIPSLGGDLVLDGAHARAYVAHRGQGLITILDTAAAPGQPTVLSCGDPTQQAGLTNLEQKTACARDHLFDLTRPFGDGVRGGGDAYRAALYQDPAALALVPDPLGNADSYPLLAVGYLGSSWLTVLSTGEGASAMGVRQALPMGTGTLSRLLTVPSSAAPAVGEALVGATHFAPDLQDRGALYSLSVGALLATTSQGAVGFDRYDLSADLGAGSEAADVPGMVFSPMDPTRLFVAHRNPDAVAILERHNVPVSQTTPSGTLTYAPRLSHTVLSTAVLDGSRLSQIAYVQRDVGGDLLAVSSLRRDMIYFFDVSHDVLSLVGRFALQAGQGPVDLLPVTDGAQRYLFITTFFDHGLTVLDLSSASPGDFRLAASLHDAATNFASSGP